MLEKLSRSLSFRLLAIFVVLAAVFVYGATHALRWIYSEDDLRELISGHLSLHVSYVRSDIGNPPRIDRAIAITERVPVDIRIAGPDIDWASDSDFPQLDDLEFGASDIFSEDPGAWLYELSDVEFAVRGAHRFLKIEQGDFNIIVSTPRISDINDNPNLILVILAIGLIWLFLAYLSVRWLFMPIGAIRRGAERIGRGDFDHRISRYRHDQLGDLAEDVNKLAADVRSMLDAKRQLLLGISHELRSPLSRLRLSLEFFEDGERKENLRTEIAEMERIIATLLEAERLNERHATINRTPVAVRELTEQMIEDFFTRDSKRIEIVMTDESVVANLDDARVILLLKNLLSNALRYSPEDGPAVQLQIDTTGSDLIFSVSDRGPGFNPAQREKIGEAFFRGDPSRTRDTGGTGLGLYLARLVAEAHGGTLTLDESHSPGARLVARFPDCIDLHSS